MKRTLRWIRGVPTVALLVAGLFLAARIWVPACWITAVDEAGILLGYLFTCLTLALALVSWSRRAEVARFLERFSRRRTFLGVGEPVALQPFRDRALALVIPVSRREQPEWLLRHFEPEHVSFLYTERSRGIAQDLARDFDGSIRFFPDVEQIERGEYVLRDPDDPKESKERTRFFFGAFEQQGIPRSGILVDTTGGKVPMSIGAFQAAEENQVSSIYLIGTVLSSRTGDRIVEDPARQDHGRPIFLSDHSVAPPAGEEPGTP